MKGFGFKSGAIATTISHDSHNIIAVGTNDADIAAAVNKLQEIGGGLTIIKMKKSFIQYRADCGVIIRPICGAGESKLADAA